MKKDKYLDYILEELGNLTAIASPSGFTANAEKYIIERLTEMGYQPSQNRKGNVLCVLGGEKNPWYLHHTSILSARWCAPSRITDA